MTHDPQVGRPAWNLPEWISRRADSWSTDSVVIERTRVISSAIPAVCGQQLGELDPRLALPGELEGRGEQVARLLVEVDLQPARVGLAVPLRQLGLGVEQVHLARPAVLEQADDRLGPGPTAGGSAALGAPTAVQVEQVREGQRARAPRRSGRRKRGG